MSATDKLIAFAQALTPASLSSEVMAQAKRCVLDLVGVAIAGSRMPMARASTRFALGQFPPGNATLIGSPARLGPLGAAWANGICASALDLDDGHRLAMGHPGSAVIPTALAVAEAEGASGADFLAAVVAGYEVAVRTSVARLPDYKAGNFATGIWGPPGSATAASKLLQLDRQAFHHALGVALAHSPFPPGGPFLHDSMVKEVIGWSNLVGCSAAFLARDGFAGPSDALDRAGRYDPVPLVEGLGAPYAILQAYIKPYAACRWSHPAIDAVLKLVRDHHLEPGMVEAISVQGFGPMARLDNPAPATTVAAQYSIPFSIALALVHGRIGPAELTDDNLQNPELQRLAGAVTLSVAPDLDRLFPERTASRVTVRTRRGTYAARVDYPRGNPENPLTDDELADKFLWLAGEVMAKDQSQALQAALAGLERMDNVKELTALFPTVPSGRGPSPSW
jgi:2-methylcitrate dehydratase PrpD